MTMLKLQHYVKITNKSCLLNKKEENDMFHALWKIEHLFKHAHEQMR